MSILNQFYQLDFIFCLCLSLISIRLTTLYFQNCIYKFDQKFLLIETVNHYQQSIFNDTLFDNSNREIFRFLIVCHSLIIQFSIPILNYFDKLQAALAVHLSRKKSISGVVIKVAHKKRVPSEVFTRRHHIFQRNEYKS